jgi:hypothetical protein
LAFLIIFQQVISQQVAKIELDCRFRSARVRLREVPANGELLGVASRKHPSMRIYSPVIVGVLGDLATGKRTGDRFAKK